MGIKKLTYDDALMLDNIVNTMNELIEEVEYINKRIDRLWKYVRIKGKGKKEDKDTS